MKVLGVNIYGHDTSAALHVDGKLVCAVEEERLSRRKHDNEIPYRSIEFCLSQGGLDINDIDFLAYATDLDFLIQRRYLQYHIENYAETKQLLAQAVSNIPDIMGRQDKLNQKIGYSGESKSYRHHLCHLASSYYQSGFEEAAVVSIDGLGEFESLLLGHGVQGDISTFYSINFPHSLGMFYNALTFFLGFKPNSGEGTVMALASMGNSDEIVPGQEVSYYEIFQQILSINSDGGFTTNTEWFNYPFTCEGWVSEKFKDHFGDVRKMESELTQHHYNIAAGMQRRFEDAYLNLLNKAQKETGSKNLSLAGGAALNCVANGKIIEKTNFEQVYIQPAAGDAGNAIGAAQLAAREMGEVLPIKMRIDTYLGPSYENSEIERALKKRGVKYISSDDPSSDAAELLSQKCVIAWFQGAAEFGPRALGNRSILAAPGPIEMKHRINAKVKHREFFRPFAPAVIEEEFNNVFNGYLPSPFMLMAMTVKDDWRERVAAIVHLDGSARVQTVNEETNPRFYKLIKAFQCKSGIPVVLNTSFNDKGEPMVCSPDDALNTFLGTDIDHMVIGNFVVSK